MKIIYFPIENYVRELSARAYVANQIHKKNGSIVIYLDQDFLFFVSKFKYLMSGSLLLKSVQKYTETWIKVFLKCKIQLFMQDEESMISFNHINENELKNRWDRHDLALLSTFKKIFCWTESEYNHYKNSYISKEIPLFTGNVRTYMLGDSDKIRYDSKDDRIINLPKKYILFSSTFSQALIKVGKNTKQELIEVAKAEKFDFYIYSLYEEWREQNHHTFFAIMEFVRLFKKSKLCDEYVLVFRPHPAEDVDFYKHIFQNIDYILVSKDFEIGFWIQNSALVIGSNCTTLVEAAVYGKPTVSFLPKINKKIDQILELSLSNEVSFKASNPAELMVTVESLLYDSDIHKNIISLNIEAARRSVNFYSNTPYLISDEMLDNIDDHNKYFVCIYVVYLFCMQPIFMLYNIIKNRKSILYKRENRDKGFIKFKSILSSNVFIAKFRYIIISYR